MVYVGNQKREKKTRKKREKTKGKGGKIQSINKKFKLFVKKIIISLLHSFFFSLLNV